MTTRRRFTHIALYLVSAFFLTIGCRLFSSSPGSSGDLEPVSPESGASRRQPVPLGSQISVPGWQIGVKEFLRGDAAFKIINDTDWPPPPLKEGEEYVLARVFIRSTSFSENYQDLGISELFITGDRCTAHGDTMDGWPQPEFLFEDIYTGEAVEGWVDAVVPAGEPNLELVLDNTDEAGVRTVRYFELEKGSALSLPADLAGLQPNEVGAAPASPASAGEQMIGKNWSLVVSESVRGAQADSTLQPDSLNFAAPAEGQEYLLLHVQARYISQQDLPATLSLNNFYAVDNSGFRFDAASIFPPKGEKWLNGIFLPGADLDGWVPVLVPRGQSPVVIAFAPQVFQPGSGEKEIRYIAIK